MLDLAPIADAAALVRRRLEEALGMRRLRLELRATNAFRWVHGEADRLPGIHVDVYASVVSLRYDGEGARAFYGHGSRLELMLLACGRDLGLRKVVDREARGQDAEEVEVEVEVMESGVRFLVDVGRGQKGGCFSNNAKTGRPWPGLQRASPCSISSATPAGSRFTPRWRARPAPTPWTSPARPWPRPAATSSSTVSISAEPVFTWPTEPPRQGRVFRSGHTGLRLAVQVSSDIWRSLHLE